MKGFKPTTKSFGFSTSADGGHSGGSTFVRPHMRAKPMPKFAKGGMVGNSAVQRSKPVTEFDSDHGGKGPLRTGYAKGGSCGSDMTQDRKLVNKAIAAHVAAPAPKGHKGLKK